MLAGEQVCEVVEAPRRRAAAAGRLSLEWRIACPADGALHIRSELSLELGSNHLHFAILHHEGGSAERVLSDRERSWRLRSPEAVGSSLVSSTSLTSYVLLGMEHIATGYDHVFFPEPGFNHDHQVVSECARASLRNKADGHLPQLTVLYEYPES